jgi:hypothetical protein
MSALAIPPQEELFRATAAPQAPLAPAARQDRFAGPTLDDVISHAWEALGAQVAAGCPVCGGELEPHAHTTGGRCAGCGTTLD